jgi:acid-sensing ion channel 2
MARILKKLIFKSQKLQCYSRCPLECFSVDYNAYASYVQFNSDLYLDVVKNRTNFLSTYDNQTLSDQAIRNGLTKVNLYYDELSYIEITEAPAMNQVALMAAIGGFMGMFLGMSFMTLVELVDIVFRIFYKKIG